jgi:hypothetical protein
MDQINGTNNYRPAKYCCATLDGNAITPGDNTDCEMGSGYFRISTEFPYDHITNIRYRW